MCVIASRRVISKRSINSSDLLCLMLPRWHLMHSVGAMKISRSSHPVPIKQRPRAVQSGVGGGGEECPVPCTHSLFSCMRKLVSAPCTASASSNASSSLQHIKQVPKKCITEGRCDIRAWHVLGHAGVHLSGMCVFR